mmetsp:Transcript_97600/g.178388  ORF Transcript_97600/g.178388 Transcript_97600/m.178388 type:complete len:702 (-) Transcript_97600:91-2196(-)
MLGGGRAHLPTSLHAAVELIFTSRSHLPALCGGRMGNGAIMRRSPRPSSATLSGTAQGALPRGSPRPSSARGSGGGPVLGGVCERVSLGSCGEELGADLEAGYLKVQCKRCGTPRMLAYGSCVFTCSACATEVRVPLSAMSARARLDAVEHVRRAEQEVQGALSKHTASRQSLWEKLKKLIANEEGIWDRSVRGVEANRARVLVRTALNTHDVAQASETLAHWDSLGLPLASPEIRASLADLKQEDDLESHWRCLARALAASDRSDLQFWCSQTVLTGCLPVEVENALQALTGKERAELVEWEYQCRLKTRAAEAHAKRDSSELRSIAAEARLLGEDASAVDTILSLLAQQNSAAAASNIEITESLTNLKASVIKDELTRRGINCAGVVEKDELVTLLRRALAESPATSDRPMTRSKSKDSASSGSSSTTTPFTARPSTGASSSSATSASSTRPSPREASLAGRPPPAAPGPALPGSNPSGIRGTPRAYATNAFHAFCNSQPRPQSATACGKPPPPPPSASPRFGGSHARTATSQPPSDARRSRQQARAFTQPPSSPSPSPGKPSRFSQRPSSASPSPARPSEGASPQWPPPGDRGSQRHSTMPGRQRPASAGPSTAKRPPPPGRLPMTRAAALSCLGLEGKPGQDEIRRAYKQAALKWHPDRPQNHGCTEEAKQHFLEVRAAFDLLQSPVRNLCAIYAGG